MLNYVDNKAEEDQRKMDLQHVRIKNPKLTRKDTRDHKPRDEPRINSANTIWTATVYSTKLIINRCTFIT